MNLPILGVCKVVIVGDTGTGKSSLALRLVDERFKKSYEATIGVDFLVKRFPVAEMENPLISLGPNGPYSVPPVHQEIKMQLWDTAGQERFLTITRAYYHAAHAVAIVYDVTNLASFTGVTFWAQEVDRFTDEPPIKLLIGNKKDLTSERLVTPEQGHQLAARLGMDFIEVSSQTGEGVYEAFLGIVRRVQKNPESSEVPQETDSFVSSGRSSCFCM